jgi:hypothetical protein
VQCEPGGSSLLQGPVRTHNHMACAGKQPGSSGPKLGSWSTTHWRSHRDTTLECHAVVQNPGPVPSCCMPQSAQAASLLVSRGITCRHTPAMAHQPVWLPCEGSLTWMLCLRLHT